MTEEQIQAECFQWFWNTYPNHRQMLFAVNNNSGNAISGNRKKAVGVVSGVSDLILVCDGSVIFIEMKTDKGVPSSQQIEFRNKVIERGHLYTIIRSIDSFKQLIWQSIGK